MNARNINTLSEICCVDERRLFNVASTPGQGRARPSSYKEAVESSFLSELLGFMAASIGT
jgi:hypothetical protein